MTLHLNLPLRIGLFTLLIAGSSVLSVSYLGYSDSAELLHDLALRSIAEELHYQSGTLINSIDHLTESVRQLADSAELQGYVRADLGGGYDPQENADMAMWHQSLLNMMKMQLKQDVSYIQIRLVQADGRERMRLDRQGERFFTANADQLESLADHENFQAGLQLTVGQIHYSDIVLKREQGRITFPPQSVLSVIARVPTPEGATWGVLVITSDFQKLASNLARHTPESGYYFIANSAGDFLLHQDADKTFGWELNRPWRLQDQFPNLQQ